MELTELSVDTLLSLSFVSVSEFTVYLGCQIVCVLLWEDLSVRDWLNSGVVVVLVDLTVDCLCGLFMSVRLDGL